MALISTTGPICPNVTDTPLDNRSRVSTIVGIGNIPLAWKGMLVYCEENGKTYKITSLKPKTSGPVVIENYYPATWVEFGSGGSTPSPSPAPSDIDAGDVSYFSSGTFSNNTVGKELQSLASNILGLAEDIHNLSGDIGTLSNLNTENKQDLVSAINEVLASTGSTISVIDNLVSNSTTNALSAHQGKVLKGLVDAKVAGIKLQGESEALPMDGTGIVTIPAGGGINGIKQGTTPLTPDQDGVVTITDFAPDITDIKNTLQKIANSEPVVIPPTAINLPTSGTFNYDSSNTYVMNVDSTQIATIHYPYTVGSTDYVAFKAIDRDLYYVYSVSSNGVTYTYNNQYTWSTLPAAAKSKFESGIYAVKQTINNDGSIPEGHWVHGVPSVFVTRHNYPLTYRQITETVGSDPVHYILIKNDEISKIYKYQSSTQNNVAIWSQVIGGCYTKGDTTTGANYDLYDKYFDRKNASDVDFDNTSTGLSSTTVQAAIAETANKLGYAVNPQATINTNPTKNEYYDFTASAISSLDVHDISVTNTNEILVLFLTSSSGCSLVLSTSQRIIGSTSLANNQVYMMSIFRGVICIVEAPAYVQAASLSSTSESE